MTAEQQAPRTEAGRTLLRQWSGHPNEEEVRIVVTAIEDQERRLTVERIRERLYWETPDEFGPLAELRQFDLDEVLATPR